ncbi:MAG: cohesin domain-containing protein [Desulfobacter sp.]
MFKFKSSYVVLILFIIAFCISSVQAEISVLKVWPNDGSKNKNFGHAVSIDGEYAAISAPGSKVHNVDPDGVSIYKKDGSSWVESTKLWGSDELQNREFGRSVSISEEYVVIGTWFSPYVFKRDGDTWTEQIRLFKPGNQYIGNGPIAIDGDYIAAAAFGGPYIFKQQGDTWINQTMLLTTDGAFAENYLTSISIDGEYLIVGVSGTDFIGTNAGSAYIFKRDGDTWTEQAKLTAFDGFAYDYFGASVSISGNYAVVGAPNDDDNRGDWQGDHPQDFNSGSAYVFKREGDTWRHHGKLTPSDVAESDFAASTASIDGDYVVIGSSRHKNGSVESGASWIFKQEDGVWIEYARLTATNWNEVRFGNDVAIDGNYILSGAPWSGVNGEHSGSAYFHKFKESPLALSVDPENQSPAVGETVCIDINVTDAHKLYSAQFDLTYDPSIFEFQSVTEGNLLGSDGGATIFNASPLDNNSKNGIIVFNTSRSSGLDGISGSGSIAQSCFKVIGGNCSETIIEVFNEQFKNASDGSITVVKNDVPRINITCQADSDNDGVPDNLDQCPDTPPGSSPDASGCDPDQLIIQNLTETIEQLNATIGNQKIEITVRDQIIVNLNTLIETMYTQKELDQAVATARSEVLDDLSDSLKIIFDDPNFEIPGDTVTEQMENLTNAIADLPTDQIEKLKNALTP